jgi:hypothetical protein
MKQLEFIYGTVMHWLDNTQTKASIILGVKLFLIGYFLTLFDVYNVHWEMRCLVMIWYLITALFSFIFLIRVIYPRTNSRLFSSNIYFRNIAHNYRDNVQKGIEDLTAMKKEDFKKSLAEQIITLSEVSDYKYKYLRRGIFFVIFELFFLILFRIL